MQPCPSLGLEWKLIFSSPMATAEFSRFAGLLSATLLQGHLFRIWNSSAGIQSHSLVLFVMMLPKAHLTSHSRMSGSRWVITPSWLSWSWRSFLYSSSVCCCHFLISPASVRSNSMKLSHAVWGHPRWAGHGGEGWQNVVQWRREWHTTSVFLPWEPHERYEKAKW